MNTLIHALKGIWNDRFKRYVSIGAGRDHGTHNDFGSPVAEQPASRHADR